MNMTHSSDKAELTERDLRDYLAAFNNNDFERFSQYYADNLVFEGRGRHFRNRDEMVGFYRKLKSRIRETVTLREVVVGRNEIAVELETELYGLEDWLDMPTGPMRKGDRSRTQNFVWYEIENGRFSHIRSARYRKLEDWEPSSVEKPFDPSSMSMPASMTEERFVRYIDDFNNDNNLDVLIAGNLYSVETNFPRNDAGYGLLLEGDGHGHFNPVDRAKSGFYVPYDVKSMASINTNNGKYILVGCNNDFLRIFKLVK